MIHNLRNANFYLMVLLDLVIFCGGILRSIPVPF